MSGDDTPQKHGSGQKPAWEPGQSGNPAGRPKGARSKLGEAFIDAVDPLTLNTQNMAIKTLDQHQHVGRPKGSTKLQCNAAILKRIRGLAGIQCTQKEAATVLGVCSETLRSFFDRHKKAQEAWEFGRDIGKASMRRFQIKQAEHNPTMAIWLGKQYLGQSDTNTFEGGKVPMSIEVKWAD